MDMEFTHGQMEENMLESGRMGSNMVKVSLQIQRVKLDRVSGIKESG